MRALFFTAVAVTVFVPMLAAQNAADWPTYNRDSAGTRYSPLKQINTSNVARLAPAWNYALQERGTLEVTPLVVKGVMYLPAGDRVVALDPVTGKEIWRYPLGAPSQSRGAAYWAGDRNNPPRILFTAGKNLIALNASTGKLDPGFGKEGIVDMEVPYSGVPTIFKNVAIVGATTGESPLGPPG